MHRGNGCSQTSCTWHPQLTLFSDCLFRAQLPRRVCDRRFQQGLRLCMEWGRGVLSKGMGRSGRYYTDPADGTGLGDETCGVVS